jgi:hypothetical protein
MTGSRCGNNPNTRLSDADRTAVTEFKEYLAHKAAVARVSALHQRYRSPLTDEFDCCGHCNRIAGDLVPYPCPTIQSLEGTA